MSEVINKQLQEVANQYRVEFLEQTNGEWTSDAMSFENHDEAEQYGKDIMNAQMSTFTDYRVILIVGGQPDA